MVSGIFYNSTNTTDISNECKSMKLPICASICLWLHSIEQNHSVNEGLCSWLWTSLELSCLFLLLSCLSLYSLFSSLPTDIIPVLHRVSPAPGFLSYCLWLMQKLGKTRGIPPIQATGLPWQPAYRALGDPCSPVNMLMRMIMLTVIVSLTVTKKGSHVISLIIISIQRLIYLDETRFIPGNWRWLKVLDTNRL